MKVLVLLVGLLRTFRETWPVVSLQLQLDRHEADVCVLTDLNTPCTEKDVKDLRCPLEWARAAEARRDLNLTIGSRLKWIEDQPGEFSGGAGRAFETRVLHFLRRQHLPPAAEVLWGAYDVTLALRPDVILVQPHPLGEHVFRRLDLARVCADFPGLRIIGGSQSRRQVFHSRDWDFAMLICAPATLRDWLLVDMQPSDRCNTSWPGCAMRRPQPPPRPPYLTGEWAAVKPKHDTSGRWMKNNLCTAPDSSMCDRVLYALRRQIPFGSLPNEVALAHAVRVRTTPDAHLEKPVVPCTMNRELPDALVVSARLRNGPCFPYAMPRLT
jgi:hypothetical protein